jgi:hypothetical protein
MMFIAQELNRRRGLGNIRRTLILTEALADQFPRAAILISTGLASMASTLTSIKFTARARRKLVLGGRAILEERTGRAAHCGEAGSSRSSIATTAKWGLTTTRVIFDAVESTASPTASQERRTSLAASCVARIPGPCGKKTRPRASDPPEEPGTAAR